MFPDIFRDFRFLLTIGTLSTFLTDFDGLHLFCLWVSSIPQCLIIGFINTSPQKSHEKPETDEPIRERHSHGDTIPMQVRKSARRCHSTRGRSPVCLSKLFNRLANSNNKRTARYPKHVFRALASNWQHVRGWDGWDLRLITGAITQLRRRKQWNEGRTSLLAPCNNTSGWANRELPCSAPWSSVWVHKHAITQQGCLSPCSVG